MDPLLSNVAVSNALSGAYFPMESYLTIVEGKRHPDK